MYSTMGFSFNPKSLILDQETQEAITEPCIPYGGKGAKIT